MVCARLDQGLMNQSWLNTFPRAQLHHLGFLTYGHCHILVKLAVDIPDQVKWKSSVQRFEPTWFKSSNCLPQFLAD